MLVPSGSDAINRIYEAVKECQLLNPDPEDMDEDDEDADMYEDADSNEVVVDHLASGDAGKRTFFAVKVGRLLEIVNVYSF